MPPVTAERSPPASRITGADSPVIADSSTEPTPSITSPSAGMISPASTTTTSPRRSSAAGTVRPSARRASVVVFVARSVAACALPRPSAIASAKFASSTVSQRKQATVTVNQPGWTAISTVVITLPISTTKMTGLWTSVRGSSLRNESRAATATSSGEKTLRASRLIGSPARVRG